MSLSALSPKKWWKVKLWLTSQGKIKWHNLAYKRSWLHISEYKTHQYPHSHWDCMTKLYYTAKGAGSCSFSSVTDQNVSNGFTGPTYERSSRCWRNPPIARLHPENADSRAWSRGGESHFKGTCSILHPSCTSAQLLMFFFRRDWPYSRVAAQMEASNLKLRDRQQRSSANMRKLTTDMMKNVYDCLVLRLWIWQRIDLSKLLWSPRFPSRR